MNITDLKEGHGIIFKTEKEKERILPVLHFLGFTNLHLTSVIAMSKMTGASLYVNIEADKKLTYSTAKNFKILYSESFNIAIPPGILLDMQLAALKPYMSHALNFTKCSDAAFDKAWDAIFNQPKSAKSGCVWTPTQKIEYPPYLYDISPQDALKLISMIPVGYRQEFKDKWGESILEGKPIIATGLTKQQYLYKVMTKHREEANKLFKVQCPYKDDELILVRHYGSNDWMPRFFYKMDSDGSVWVHGIGNTATVVYKLHCKAKVIPA